MLKPKSFVATLLLSILPGLGHLYLGLTRRGVQLMTGAFLCIIMIPLLPMIFPFALTVIWFYSFFDALKRLSIMNNYIIYHNKHKDEEVVPSLSTVSEFETLDEDVFFYTKESRNKQGEKWLAGFLLLFGGVLLSKIIYPPFWHWMVSQDGASMILGVMLVGHGLFTIVMHFRK